MALEQRIESLRKRHTEIDLELHAEEIRPSPDETLIHRLKCLKLHIKDELSRLRGGHERQAA